MYWDMFPLLEFNGKLQYYEMKKLLEQLLCVKTRSGYNVSWVLPVIPCDCRETMSSSSSDQRPDKACRSLLTTRSRARLWRDFFQHLQCCEVTETSLKLANELASDVHLHVFGFKHFGKGLVKTFKVSPDAFIQTALQLAHWRVSNAFEFIVSFL